jgi:putative hydrolase of the HAD superfamily
MKIKGIVFDIGQTLVYYPIPLNWSALYRPAFESIAKKHGLNITEEEYAHIGKTLMKYNTRITPRETEVPSDVIFTEILEGTGIPMAFLDAIKRDFYSYFRNEARVYEEVPETLKFLKSMGIVTGTFSDVPYGMDNEFAFADIAEVIGYIDIPFTSNDAGYRKPHPRGLEILADKIKTVPPEMIFVGDERKDVECAVKAGAVAVLINRDDEEKDFGQDYTIRSLKELPDILSRF